MALDTAASALDTPGGDAPRPTAQRRRSVVAPRAPLPLAVGPRCIVNLLVDVYYYSWVGQVNK
jgi:hypothetical protein